MRLRVMPSLTWTRCSMSGNYEDKYTNASKNVVNLISPNNYNFVDGIYAFKGMPLFITLIIEFYQNSNQIARLNNKNIKILRFYFPWNFGRRRSE